MRTIPVLILMAVVLTLSIPVPAGVKKAEQLFAGTWIVTNGAYKDKPYLQLKGEKITFSEDGRVSIQPKDGKEHKGAFSVDIGAKPQRVDIIAGEKKMYGVYEFTGNILRICYASDPAHRPGELRTEPGKEWTLLILTRGTP